MNHKKKLQENLQNFFVRPHICASDIWNCICVGGWMDGCVCGMEKENRTVLQKF